MGVGFLVVGVGLVVVVGGGAGRLTAALLALFLGHERFEVRAVFSQMVAWASVSHIDGVVLAKRAHFVFALDVLARCSHNRHSHRGVAARIVTGQERLTRRDGGVDSGQDRFDGQDGFRCIYACAGAQELIIKFARDVLPEISYSCCKDSNGDWLRVRRGALLVVQEIPRAKCVEALGRWYGDASRDNLLALRHGPRADFFRRLVADNMEDQGASVAFACDLQIVAFRLVRDGGENVIDKFLVDSFAVMKGRRVVFGFLFRQGVSARCAALVGPMAHARRVVPGGACDIAVPQICRVFERLGNCSVS